MPYHRDYTQDWNDPYNLDTYKLNEINPYISHF